jgi:hypothetical protein
MAERITDEDVDLLGELGVDTAPAATGGRSAREQRIIAGFEEIERFVAENGRVPQHGESRDIFERLYAVRLDRMRGSDECRQILTGLDSRGLLNPGGQNETSPETLDDAALLSALGVEPSSEADLANLVHVRSRDEIKSAEEIAQRNPCKDFAQFKPVFDQAQAELASGDRQTVKYKDNAEVAKGDVFVLDGQKVIVAELGDPFVGEHGRPDRRLRVVYDNGTESNLLVRSLQRALNKDKASRRILDAGPGPLFSSESEEDDLETGCIYILQSKSTHPFVVENKLILHKIGVTGGDVKTRIAGAKKDPTYLLADVEIVATYKLANLNRNALESLLHKFFGSARLDLQLKDRFGSGVEPKEWFLVPLPAIDDAISKLIAGTIGSYKYEPETATVVRAQNSEC